MKIIKSILFIIMRFFEWTEFWRGSPFKDVYESSVFVLSFALTNFLVILSVLKVADLTILGIVTFLLYSLGWIIFQLCIKFILDRTIANELNADYKSDLYKNGKFILFGGIISFINFISVFILGYYVFVCALK